MTTRPDKPLPPAVSVHDNALPHLKFDPNEYREHIGECELTEAQQNEVLEILWNIMSTMVNIGWGVDSVQMFLPELFEKAGTDSDQLLEQDISLSDHHCKAVLKGGMRKESNHD